MTRSFDLIVVGAGPGGYEAALKGAASGLRTALVERNILGGTCLNWGCIPTKLFLGATAPVDELAAQSRLRMASGSIAVDLPQLQKRKALVLKSTRQAMQAALAKASVELIQGTARLAGPERIEVETEGGVQSFGFGSLILATGSRPAAYPGLSADNEAVLDSTGLLDLSEPPDSLIVIGAGVIGLEMAQIFERLGTKITLLEALDRVAPGEDPDISRELAKIFSRHGWEIATGVKVATLETADGRARVVLEDGREFSAAKALLAVGRHPNTEGLNLAAAAIKTSGPGWIATDDHLRAAPNIHAIGDVNGRVLLAHAAANQAEYVVDLIAGRADGPYAPGPIPSCIYGSPESVRVGRMPAELAGLPGVVEVSRAQLVANPIAQAHGASQGFVKAVWRDGRLEGLAAVGFGVSAFAVSATIMVNQAWRREDVERLVFPHPSLDEALRDALLTKPVAVE